MSSKSFKQIHINGKVVNAIVVDEQSLNQYVEKDAELMEFAKMEEEATKSNSKNQPSKIRAKDIQIQPGVIPTKEEICILCIHGYTKKIMAIEKSYFTKGIRGELIIQMKSTVDDIKKWLAEDENQSPQKISYLQHRKSGIFRIINYFRAMDNLEKAEKKSPW